MGQRVGRPLSQAHPFERGVIRCHRTVQNRIHGRVTLTFKACQHQLQIDERLISGDTLGRRFLSAGLLAGFLELGDDAFAVTDGIGQCVQFEAGVAVGAALRTCRGRCARKLANRTVAASNSASIASESVGSASGSGLPRRMVGDIGCAC
jgi:hypothetical protein